MSTLWDKLTKKKDPPPVSPELKIYNPLQKKINDLLHLNMVENGVDLATISFTIRKIREVVRQVEDQALKFADYIILGRTLDGKEIRKMIRLIPAENPDGDTTHSVIMFSRLDGFQYDKGFHEGLAYEKNKGEFREGDKLYYRPTPDGSSEPIKLPWETETVSVSDLDNTGKITDNDVKRGTMTYWDFGNQFKDEGGNDYVEWYIVEMDESGYFEIWVGSETDPSRISDD